MSALKVLLLLALLLHASASCADPKWLKVSQYPAMNNATATVFIDTTSVIKTGQLIRVWVMVDFSEFQEGDWHAPSGESRAYMSQRQLQVVDCRTKDLGSGTWTALDGPRGTGSVVRSENKAVPIAANFPVAPGTVGEAIANESCKRAK